MLVLARCSASSSRPFHLSRCLHSTPPTPARFKRVNQHQVEQTMKGFRNMDNKKLPARHRLSKDATSSKNIHPDLIPRYGPKHMRAKPIDPRTPLPIQSQIPTAKINPLIVGKSKPITTPPRRKAPKPVQHPAQNQLQPKSPEQKKADKKAELADFVFKPEPLQKRPPVAGHQKNHPTLTHLPTHFNSPPIRPGLMLALSEYLPSPNGKQFQPTPVQRLSLGHFFPAPPLDPKTGQPLRMTVVDPSVVPRGMRPGSKTLLAAETGSGKTLAYLLPMCHQLKAAEDKRIDEGEVFDVKAPLPQGTVRLRPRALVLAPTHELARQIAQTMKVMTHHARLRVTCLSAGRGEDPHSYDKHTDILVGTVSRVRELMGLQGRRDEMIEEKRTKAQEASLKKFIEEQKARRTKKREKGEDEQIDASKRSDEEWFPNPMLNWEQNYEEKQEFDRAKRVAKRLSKGLPEEEEKPVFKLDVPKAADKTQHLSLERLEWLIIDEADVVLNVDFLNETLPLIDPILKAESAPRFVLATATVPDFLSGFIARNYTDMTRLVTPNLHRLPSTLSLGKVRWSGGNWRADILLEIRRAFVEDAQNGHMDSQIIVFINKNVKAEDFGQYLTEYGVPSVTLTGESKNRGRGHSMAINPFLTQPKYQTSASAWSKRQQAKEEVDPALPPVEYKPPPPGPRVLVTTGLLSRGLDFSPKVKTIIITDEPRNAVDFIHRAGRAGRAGAGGRVIIFTGDGEKRSLHRMGGGKGRGGAIYKTILEAKRRFEGRGTGAHSSGKRRKLKSP